MGQCTGKENGERSRILVLHGSEYSRIRCLMEFENSSMNH